MPDLSLRVIALLWAALANALLAALVWWRYGRQRLMRLFAFSVAGVALYGLFVAGLAGFQSEEEATNWIRSTTLLPYLTLLSFFYFASVLARAEGKWVRLIRGFGWTAAVVDSLGRFSGVAPVKLVHHPTQGWFPAGPDVFYFLLYLPSLLLLVGGGLVLLWRRRRQAQGREKVQLTYVFLAMYLGLALTLFNFSGDLAPLAAAGPVAFTSVLAFAILRRRLLDIRLLLQRGAVAAAMSVGLGFAAVAAILLGRRAWPYSEYGDIFAALLAASVFSLAHGPLRRLAGAWAERLTSIRPWESGARLLEFSQLSSLFMRWEHFTEASAQKLVEDFQLENATLIMPDQRGLLRHVVQAPLGAQRPVDPPSNSLLKRLSEAKQGLDLDDLAWARQYEAHDQAAQPDDPDDAEARAFLTLNHAQLAFGLQGSQKNQGVMLVGPTLSGRTFNEQDVAFFTALAAQLGKAVENQHLHGRVQQADRLSSLGTMAASLTHEIRNPLSSITLFMAMLPKRHTEPEFIERFCRVVGKEVERLTQLADQMLTYAKPIVSDKQSLDLGRLAERTRQLMSYHFAKRQVKLSLHAAPGVMVRGAEAEISQVLVNLLLNALDASEPEQEISITVEAQGPVALLAVTDQGKGISKDLQAQLFEPFFTTKDTGTGLGLATCLRIVQAGGGNIAIDSKPGQGATFKVTLPVASEPLAPVA